jgi:hypothetical protein
MAKDDGLLDGIALDPRNEICAARIAAWFMALGLAAFAVSALLRFS